jgi:hypothetical protein
MECPDGYSDFNSIQVCENCFDKCRTCEGGG